MGERVRIKGQATDALPLNLLLIIQCQPAFAATITAASAAAAGTDALKGEDSSWCGRSIGQSIRLNGKHATNDDDDDVVFERKKRTDKERRRS